MLYDLIIGQLKQTESEKLTPREQDVFYHEFLGHSDNHIAETLGVSKRTVLEYKLNLKNKLSEKSFAHIVRELILTVVHNAIHENTNNKP